MLTPTFAGFDTGPQFVFNLGGQRGFRVHQMGGAGPRRRPRDAAAAAAAANGQRREASGWDTLVSLLPILLRVLPPITRDLEGQKRDPHRWVTVLGLALYVAAVTVVVLIP